MTTCTQPMFLQLQLLSVLVPLPRIQGEFIKVHLHRALMCPVVPRLHQRLHFASYLNMQFSHFVSPPFLHLTLIPFHVSPVHTMNLCLRPVLQAVYVCTASIALNTQILDWTLSRNAGLFFFFLLAVFLLRQNEVTLSVFVNFRKKIVFSVHCPRGQIFIFNS